MDMSDKLVAEGADDLEQAREALRTGSIGVRPSRGLTGFGAIAGASIGRKLIAMFGAAAAAAILL